LTEKADAVVVGGGVVGACTAYLLAKAGLEVCILEKEGLASGASGHGHGLISLIGNDFAPGAHFALGLAGARMYADFTAQIFEDSGVDPAYHEKQALSFAVVEDEERIFRGCMERQETRDNVDMRWISIDEVRAIEPRLTPDAIGGILYRHGQVDAPRLSLAGATAVERLGGSVLLREATGLTCVDGRVTAVEHSGGSIATDTVVLAGGAWIGVASQWLNFPVPVRPRHGEVLHVRLPGEPVGMFILTALHGPIAPRRDGILMMGSVGGVTMGGPNIDSELRFDPGDSTVMDFDLQPKDANRTMMIDKACRVMPAVEDAELVAHLAGVRPMSADRLPIIGRVPGVEGAYLATGHGTKGIHLAPPTAQLVANAIVGGDPLDGVDPAEFLPDRFASVAPAGTGAWG
jgi:glycine/D-amino acid oxidase-like deaminating enzyme